MRGLQQSRPSVHRQSRDNQAPPRGAPSPRQRPGAGAEPHPGAGVVGPGGHPIHIQRKQDSLHCLPCQKR